MNQRKSKRITTNELQPKLPSAGSNKDYSSANNSQKSHSIRAHEHEELIENQRRKSESIANKKEKERLYQNVLNSKNKSFSKILNQNNLLNHFGSGMQSSESVVHLGIMDMTDETKKV